jgi:hypothetical protein
MLLGASWNLRLDVPMNPDEINELLDEKTLNDFRKAVEADTALASRVIVQAGEGLESGVLKGLRPIAGEPMHVTVEREIVKARAAARAAAAVPQGHRVMGIGSVPDGLVFETTSGGRKRPMLISVNVATGQYFKVIWRNGRYLLMTIGNRTLDSDTDLWWLLLLLALLEKQRRDEAERKRQEELAREAAKI